jgi:Spy/CpxP family protein refolding chaperone
MKTSHHCLYLIGSALALLPLQTVLADSTTATTQATSSGCQNGRKEHLKKALASLDLTDAQKEQIKQIRAGGADRKERFEQILAVLTPDQKAKLRELRKEHHNGE